MPLQQFAQGAQVSLYDTSRGYFAGSIDCSSARMPVAVGLLPWSFRCLESENEEGGNGGGGEWSSGVMKCVFDANAGCLKFTTLAAEAISAQPSATKLLITLDGITWTDSTLVFNMYSEKRHAKRASHPPPSPSPSPPSPSPSPLPLCSLLQVVLWSMSQQARRSRRRRSGTNTK